MPKNPVLAKFTRPRLHGVFARERLFGWLDGHADYPVAWIAGPGGAGKTTLVAGYLAERGLKGVWYQVDAGDKDPASLFHYLGEALAQGKTRKALLPQLGPEYLADLPGFARRYFRAFFQALPGSAVLVLDNWQEAESPLFHTLMREAFAEVPVGCRVIVISRTEPPDELGRMQANRSLALLDAGQLEFTAEESRQLATTYGVSDAQEVESMRQVTSGWAAGLILMLEARKRGKAKTDAQAPESRQPVFGYLAEEVFKHAPQHVQSFWLRTAFFPFLTVPMAEAASQSPQAGAILAESHRNHFFTDRRLQPDPVYQYHALFRDFLLAKSRESHAPGEWIEMQRNAAALLEQNGQLDAAVHWYQEIGDVEAIARIVLQNAQTLAMQGRAQTLLSWISMLPQPVLDGMPWLGFWKSACLLYTAPAQARALLRENYTRFQQSGDLLGKILTAAAYVESHMLEYGNDVYGIDPWLAVLEEETVGKDLALPREVGMRVTLSLLFGLLMRKPQSPLLPEVMEQAMAWLDEDIDVNLKLTLATSVFTCQMWRGDFIFLGKLTQRLAPMLDDPALRPLLRALYQGTYLCAYHLYTGELKIAQQDSRAGLQIASQNGLAYLADNFNHHLSLALVLNGELREALPLLDELSRKMARVTTLEKVLHLHARVTYELWTGNADKAEEYAAEYRQVAGQGGVRVPIAWGDLLSAQCAIEKNNPQSALQYLANARALFEAMRAQLGLYIVSLCESDAYWLAGDAAQGLALLRQGMEIGRRENYVMHQWWYPQQMSRVCERAFRDNIETEYVRRLVNMWSLAPASVEVEDWPWPLKIYTLGRFTVLKDNVALESGGKSKHKQLDLLKALVALGGRNVGAEKLAEALWPDAEADSAMSTLRSTLHRLRKFLGDEEAVTLENGVMTLNAKRTWVDAWAFERVAGRITGNGKNLGDTQQDEIGRQLLRLYQGKFLDREAESNWCMKMRDRLENRFLVAVLALGAAWEKRDGWQRAIVLYQGGLDLAPASEELHRRLMTCHGRLGQKAEALSAYERCRKMLGELFQTAPSRETEALRAALCE